MRHGNAACSSTGLVSSLAGALAPGCLMRKHESKRGAMATGEADRERESPAMAAFRNNPAQGIFIEGFN